jgi:putative intracellular protease/amidase
MKFKMLGLMVLFCILVSGQTLGAESKGKVLMILRTSYPGLTDMMLVKEAGGMKALLNEAGFDVVTATAFGELVKGATASLQPDLRLDDVQVNDYVGVVVPCMGSNDPPIAKAVEIVSQAWKMGKPLAAQNGGVFTLGQAGALKGKRFTCQPEDAHWIADGIYAGIGVVVDGNVVTSGTCPFMANQLNKPDGTAELTKKFIALLQ